MTATAVQLDLFAGDPETRRLVDGLTCLRDAVPEAMHLLVHLADWRNRNDRSIGTSGDWAYAVRRDGIRYEHVNDWWDGARLRGERWGWDRTPAQSVAWEELATNVGSHPRRVDVLAWAGALPEPAWRELTRPYELWPNPGTWNPGFIEHDHEHPGWPARIAAWRALQQICTDAIFRLENS